MNRTYQAQFQIAIKEDLHNFFTDSFFSSIAAIIHFTIIILLYAAANQTSYYGLFTWSMIVWYLIITQIISTFGSDIVNEINEGVQNGTIINALTKPYFYPLSVYATSIGSNLVGALSALALLTPMGLFISDIPFSIQSVLLGCILIFFAITINFLILFCIGLIAFWTEDSKPYNWIYQKLMFVIGGLIFPLEVFPDFLRYVAKLLPPAYILYYPAKLIVAFQWSEFWQVIRMQIFYLIVLSLIAKFMYDRAVKKVSINGG